MAVGHGGELTYLIGSHVDLYEFQKDIGQRMGKGCNDQNYENEQEQQPRSSLSISAEILTSRRQERDGRCYDTIEVNAIAALDKCPYHLRINQALGP